VQISRGARRAVDRLNERYPLGEITRSFVSHVSAALQELEKSPDIPAPCVDSVVRIALALVARSSGVLQGNHGGQYLLHVWRRSDALSRLLGGALPVEERFALIELATLVCIERSWVGLPPPKFAPLHEPWWMLLNAVVETVMVGDNQTKRWQEIIARLRKAPVEGAPQNVACALAWCGMVDIERGELVDEDFAYAACK
jgi:hypothetical protein